VSSTCPWTRPAGGCAATPAGTASAMAAAVASVVAQRHQHTAILQRRSFMPFLHRRGGGRGESSITPD
jgi:uncharacterized protein (TIGR03382 family)